MSYWQQVETVAEMADCYGWVVAGAILLAFVLNRVTPPPHVQLRTALFLIVSSFVGMLLCGLVLHTAPEQAGSAGFRALHFASQLMFYAALLNLGGVLLFRVLLPPIHLSPPPILRDTLLGLAFLVVTMALLGRHGVDVSGLVATSAVVTAVIGFSLQDTLGNVMGGVALQMEQSIAVGDWIRVGDVEGLVREIRWRQTSIETRNWDTVVIPNSVLMKSQVTVLGRRDGKPRLHRMWVEFNVDFRHSPGDVIDAVEKALRLDAIPNVAVDPPPNCILWDLRESYGHYAVRYWLIDFAQDDPTSSEVRARLFAALERVGIQLSIPAQSVFLTKEGRGRKERKRQEAIERRVAALQAVKLLLPLNDQERLELAGRVCPAPFRQGEVITRQGNQSHYLYVLIKGEVEVRTAVDGESRAVSRHHAVDVFGEMGMMTGVVRFATVTALTDVVCFRLDKESFQDILQRRPEIAESMSHLMTERKLELDAVIAGLSLDAVRHRAAHTQDDLLQKIKKFFTLE